MFLVTAGSIFWEDARMVRTADGTMYKSRLKVLMEFFRRSRDGWKQKCTDAKAALKKAHNLNRWLATSRDEWKAAARELKAELQCLREEQKTTLR